MVDNKSFLSSTVLTESLINSTYLPTISQVAGVFGGLAGQDKWIKFCNRPESPVYEFWTQEYIRALSRYLISRSGKPNANPLIVLEVGAGDGRLSGFLQEQLAANHSQIQIIATDNGSLNIKPIFPVEQIDYNKAIRKYKPQIIICSWMPRGKNWTSQFQTDPKVVEYILIGPADDEICGTRATWGLPNGRQKDDPYFTPEYQRWGFERQTLTELSDLQISRLGPPGTNYSSTVSFRRIIDL